MGDCDDLQRFVDAQAAQYDTARAELRRGAKRTHWIWFVFPALKIRSSMTLFAAVCADASEAADFRAVLNRYYGGLPDQRTLDLVSGV